MEFVRYLCCRNLSDKVPKGNSSCKFKNETMNMKSYAVCPVSDRKVSEQVARVNGIFTVLLLIIFGLTKSILPVIFLSFDFFLRSFNFSGYSLLAVSSKRIVSYFDLKQNFINAGPKIFAARIGLLFSCLIIISYFFNADLPAFSLAGVLLLFSLLESVWGLCVACEIYPFVYRLLYKMKFQ
jgi:hypothetical protein